MSTSRAFGLGLLCYLLGPLSPAWGKSLAVDTGKVARTADVIALVRVDEVRELQPRGPGQYPRQRVSMTVIEAIKGNVGKSGLLAVETRPPSLDDGSDYKAYAVDNVYLVFLVKKGEAYWAAYGRSGVFPKVGPNVQAWSKPGTPRYVTQVCDYARVKRQIAGALGTEGKRRQAQTPLAITVRVLRGEISQARSAEVRIALRNTGRKDTWIDGRLVLGHHVDLYLLRQSGRHERLRYPAFALVLAGRKDFVRVAPGEQVTKPVRITGEMLPAFVRPGAHLLIAVKVTLIDSGGRFGLVGWTGTLKAYFPLAVGRLGGDRRAN